MIRLSNIFLFFPVMELGFTAREARIGMRACQGNVAAATEFIMKRRQVCGVLYQVQVDVHNALVTFFRTTCLLKKSCACA
jgi:hypothetical protein